jgi:phytoene dehydrogenase-like protein
LPLANHGLEWIDPPIALAHPFDDGTAAFMTRSVKETASSLGPDAAAYEQLMAPLVRDAERLAVQLLGPFKLPRNPVTMARFGFAGLRSAEGLAKSRFTGERAPAFFAGLAAHSMLLLDSAPTAAFGLMLAILGHAVGWPVPNGGSQSIIDALAAHLRSLGGEIRSGVAVESLDGIAENQAVLLDVTPRQLLDIAGNRLPNRYRARLGRYRYGVGVFKVDWALDGPVPWTAPEARLAGTLHLGGSMPEIAAAEHEAVSGRHPERPFVLVAQQSLFDPSRAPDGKQTLWAYCHVPHGSTEDMTERIERQIERFAPGFRDRILARSTMSSADLERYNPNYIGGDINGGSQDLRQLFTRPLPQRDPYRTPDPKLFLCSSSTPPGGGVHGMAGYHAANSALRRAW